MEQRINYWTIPCNINDYDVVSAFKELKTIEWKQVLSSVCVGDIVYIYVGKPYSQILYKCKINKVNLDRTTIDDKKFWSDPNNYGSYLNEVRSLLVQDKVISHIFLLFFGIYSIFSCLCFQAYFQIFRYT